MSLRPRCGARLRNRPRSRAEFEFRAVRGGESRVRLRESGGRRRGDGMTVPSRRVFLRLSLNQRTRDEVRARACRGAAVGALSIFFGSDMR